MATKKNTAAPAAKATEVTADFFTRNSKLIYGGIIAVIVLVIGGFILSNVLGNRKEKAANLSDGARAHMELALSTADSTEFRLALNGDEAQSS